MTTTYSVTGVALLEDVTVDATSSFSIVFEDNITAISYDVLLPVPGDLPIVEVTTPIISITLDGFTAGEGEPLSLDEASVAIGSLDWSGGTTLIAQVALVIGNNALVGIFPIGGSQLPASALQGFFSFATFLFSEVNGDIDALDSVFGTAGSPFAPGQSIPLASLNWDSIVNTDTEPRTTPSADTLDLSAETDGQELDGLGGNDTILGGSGNDTIMGGFGFDSIDGGAGNDSLMGNGNADTLIGGEGNDTLVDDAGTDSLVGGDGNDRIISGSGADRIDGGDGDDFIRAGSNFGSSVDGVNGGDGNDTIFGDAGFDLLLGGDGDDVIDGGAQADNVFGDAGNDTILGGDGFDRLFGGIGDDSIDGQQGTDALFGSFGDDTLNGGDDRDRFFGGADNDILNGDGGDDELLGGGGFDTVNGGTGDDRLLGNFNADTFVFEDGHGNDTIADFDEFNGFEKIDLSAIAGINSLADLNLGSDTEGAAVQSGADVVITTSSGNTILVQSVLLADLDASDFIF